MYFVVLQLVGAVVMKCAAIAMNKTASKTCVTDFVRLLSSSLFTPTKIAYRMKYSAAANKRISTVDLVSANSK